MGSNPFMPNPAISGALAGYQGWKNQVAENDAKKLQKDQLAWQRQQYTDAQGQKTQQAQFERIKAANAEADKAVSDFDNSTNANDPNQLYDQVSQIEGMYGLAPGSILGRVRAARGGALETAPPANMGGGNLGTAAPKDMGSGDLGMAPGSPDAPVDANPVPMPAPLPQPTNQGYPNVMAGPAGAGLPPPRVPPAQPLPSMPPNALQALGARGIGPGGIPGGYSPTNNFQMPNPLANGTPGPPPPFGPVPQSPQGSLTPSDMQTPAGSQPWQPAPGPQGQLPQAPFRGPWGAAKTGLVPVGTDPIAAAQAAVDRANANLQALSPFAGHATRANAEKAVKDAVTDLTAARRDQLSGQTEFNKLRIASAGGKLPAGTLLDSANDLRPLGYNVNIPMHTIDRGLQPEEWDKIDRVAQAAYDANPKTWQDTQYNGHPLSYYLDENGNRQQIADVDQSQVAQDTHAKTVEQTLDMKSRQALTEATRRYLENTKTPQAQAQTRMIDANLEYLQKVKTPETIAITKLITEGKIPEAAQQIAKLKLDVTGLGIANDIATQKATGTYNPGNNVPGYLNPTQKMQFAGQQARLNKLDTNILAANQIKKTAAGNPNLSPGDKKAIYDAQDVDIKAWKAEKGRVQTNIDQMGTTTQSGSAGDSVPVIPSALGPSIDATAQAMQKDGRANQPHYCERVARQTYQANTNAYNKYYAGTAKETAQNFIKAGIAKPYKPGQPVPAGSLLYSTTMGGKNGHVQVVGNDGTRYDQYGPNKFNSSNFNWYVPPPGGSSAKTANTPPAAPSASSTILQGSINGQQTVFHAPRNKAEFDALTPAKKAAYVAYYQAHKGKA